jgi:hypothetical protein
MSAARGYLTIAAGRPRFLEMAVDMALSLREHTSLPIAIATDEALAGAAGDRYAPVFDVVTRVPDRFLDGRGLKYGSAEASPFEETMFVDADCMVLGSLERWWSPLAEHDMAMLGELLTVQENENHHGFSTRSLMRRFGLDRYLKTNSGIFCFRRSAALAIMEECIACYRDEIRPELRLSILLGRWVGDEIAFGIVGGRRRLGTLPLPHPMYWPREFESLDPANPSKPLLHMIWPLLPATLETLLAAAARRRRVAGVPGDAAEHWRDEVRELRRMAGRRRMLERLRVWK